MMGNAVEVIGKVQNDLSMKIYQATDFGGNIGMCVVLFCFGSAEGGW